MVVSPANPVLPGQAARRWGGAELLLALWVALALVTLVVVTGLLQAAFPIFTVVWLVVPLVAVLRSRDAGASGFRTVTSRRFLTTTAITLGGILLLGGLCEAWSHTYGTLVAKAVHGESLDSTFAWLVRYEGLPAWSGLLLYSGLVTIFGEELFFRGWLLQVLLKRLRPAGAIAIQALLFTVPQALAALLLPPLQGVLYVVIYSWLAIGMLGGWAAWRTQSIWPSLAAATLFNLIITFLVLSG
jgi:membrane protease YdiL (CAAX protease family)